MADRSAGPGRMTAGELTGFLDSRPSGAVCVVDGDGRLLALPARVLGADPDALRVEVPGENVEAVLAMERAGCVVADVFESYESIRGVIVQGDAQCLGTTAVGSVVTVNTTRVTTFSFANAFRK